MIKHSVSKSVVAGILLCAFSGAASMAVAAPAAGRKAAAEAPKPDGTPIEYSALEQRVGDQVIVETTMNTVRRGTLLKYTNPTLTLELGPENGNITLSVPRETIRSLRVIPAEPAATDSDGAGSAETN
jgi:hypothetical protein